ncbi:MAG: hypothetical protein AB8C95_10035 [Phycisphaeraceae bacterium]
MVGWLYINNEVAAPVRMLESDQRSGVVTIEVASRFVPSRTMLRRETIVEYRHWSERRLIRCLGAEHVGNALMIEAVDVGPANLEHDDKQPQAVGTPEDWLTVNGKAHCQITELRTHQQPQGHCLFNVGLTDWRDLRIGENAPLACIGIRLSTGHDNDGSITPLLHSARETPYPFTPPKVEIVRLRERQRLTIHPIATDWGDQTTLVVARVNDVAPLRQPRHSEPAIAR